MTNDRPVSPTGDMLNAHLLAMLKGWSAYGYELVQRLNEAGLGEYNKGSVYRALRQLEQMGLVCSMWDTSQSGPARRMYELTQAGTLFLQNWLALVDLHRNMIEQLLAVGGATAGRARDTGNARRGDD
ncbi:MAG: helix-turn-helix transcriptional regulator [Gammaproteobacteria bacterium]